MKKIGLVLLLIVLSFVNATGCLNAFTLKDGTVISDMHSYGIDAAYIGIPTGHRFIEQRFPLALKRLDSLWKVTHDVDYYSDYALVLILQGKYEEAKNRYLEIEKIKPDRYATASNLGTVYELLGDDKNALKWIRKAVAIDSSSHYNSEWLHVKILEAKMKGDTFISSDFLLNADFGKDTIPVSNMSKIELRKLSGTLYYQLNERVSFIKPKDKIVAQLLFDLANVMTLIDENKENALVVYTMAKEYGYSDPILDLRLSYLKRQQSVNAVQPDCTLVIVKPSARIPMSDTNYTLFYILGICTSILSIGAFFFFKKKKK